jgi:hypothetical protein
MLKLERFYPLIRLSPKQPLHVMRLRAITKVGKSCTTRVYRSKMPSKRTSLYCID